MNRKQLIAWLKSIGFKGPFNDLAKVKSWLELEGYDPDNLPVEDGEKKYQVAVEAVWKKAPKALTLTSADEGDGDEGDKGAKSRASDEDKNDAEDLQRQLRELQAKFKEREEKWRLSERDEQLAEAEAGDKGNATNGRMDAKNWANVARRKAYTRKIADGRANFPDADIAEAFGANFRMAVSNYFDRDYSGKKYDGLVLKASQVEYDDTLGGSLVPREFSTYYQKIREKYGVCRSLARVVQMSRDVQEFPRRQLGTGASFTVYAPGESSAITASNFKVAKVKLVAQKLGALTTVSTEVYTDAAINIADLVADEMAWSFGVNEDAMYFNGDGTSTYFGINGITNSFKGLSGTVANIAGLFQASSATWSSQVLGDLESVAALLPELEGVDDGYWVVNKRYYWNVMARLMYAGGGNTVEWIGGKPTRTFLGYPVVFARKMPRVGGTSGDIVAYLGDHKFAATIGDVTGGIRIDTSTDRYFDQDIIAFRATERIAMTFHDIGDANATEASRNPGPVVGLIQP